MVFISDRDGDFDIYLMDADGTNATALTSNSVLDTSPAWSPDGSRIAFASERDGNSEIYVMGGDGSAPRRLTFNAVEDTGPAFSPDGTRIAFTSHRDGNGEIYVMNADGSGQTRLTSAATLEQSPDWQPLAAPSQPRSGPQARDRRPPRIILRVSRRQRILRRGALVLRAGCDEACRIVASGRVLARRQLVARLRTVKRAVGPQDRTWLRLRLLRKGRRATRVALSRSDAVIARIRVVAHDEVGNRRSVRRIVRIAG